MRNERRGSGFLQRAGLIMAALAILGLTFTLGILVGRQWGGRGAPAPSAAAETPKKPIVAARRNGLTEAEGERTREPQEKLTFYQTLTAPMGPTGSSARARAAEDRSRAGVTAPATAASAPVATPVSAPAPVETAGAPAATATSATWSVQVGAFRSRQQADGIQKQLTEAGFPVSQSAVAAEDGLPRYRVRVGGARSRDEALRLAERVRARVPVTTFVVAN
jgi:cell division protein FtsN